MKAAVMKGRGRSASFGISDVELPKIASDEVLVQVYASSVNPVDWQTNKALSFVPQFAFHQPLILGSDLSGVVLEKGSKVSEFEIGDAVYGTNGISIDSVADRPCITGTYAEYTAVKANKIAKKPVNITFNQAATIPLVALTALQGLQKAELKAGDNVLVIGGSGGVGSMAVQIAKSKGAIVTAVCSTKNIAFVRGLGADKLIDYTTESYLNKPASYDIVFNTIGHQVLSSCSNLLKQGGVFIDCAMPGLIGSLGLLRRYMFSPKHRNVFFLYHSSRADLQLLTQLIESGKLKAVVAHEISLSEINEGHRQSQTGRTVGKIAVIVKTQD